MLDRNTKTRLGCRTRGQGIEDVHTHPWMSSIDWENIRNKDIQPPFVPDVGFGNTFSIIDSHTFLFRGFR